MDCDVGITLFSKDSLPMILRPQDRHPPRQREEVTGTIDRLVDLSG
ncbi:hypothetical protein [Melghirimyces thermohalophilus]|nr:hypothetical protein [Melghirimyces thermohalophilus]